MNHRGTETQRRQKERGPGSPLSFCLLCVSVPLWFALGLAPHHEHAAILARLIRRGEIRTRRLRAVGERPEEQQPARTCEQHLAVLISSDVEVRPVAERNDLQESTTKHHAVLCLIGPLKRRRQGPAM